MNRFKVRRAGLYIQSVFVDERTYDQVHAPFFVNCTGSHAKRFTLAVYLS